MIVRRLTRLAPHPAVLASAFVCCAPTSWAADIDRGYDLTNPSFISALLKPIVKLVQSPYDNPTQLESPLSVSASSTSAAIVMQSVVTGIEPAAVGTPGIDAFEATDSSPSPQLEMTSPTLADDTLTNFSAIDTVPEHVHLGETIAMTGR